MRAVAAVIALAVLLPAIPVDARPLPETTAAARALVHDVLEGADADAAKLLRQAHRVLREARDVAGGIAPLSPGALEVRLSLLQPPIAGADGIIAALWIGASRETWTGVYWVETSRGSVQPGIIEVNEDGVILVLDGGANLDPGAFGVTYHFLDLQGRHVRHDVGRTEVLPAIPVLDRADVGGAEASHRGRLPEAIFLSPWNLFAEHAVIGLTIKAGRDALTDITVVSCADYETPIMEPGCRQLYVLEFPAEATHVEIWHETDGNRVVDRAIDRATLERGYTYR